MDERLSQPGWLTYSGWFIHISGHPSAVGRAQYRECSPVKDQRSTAVPCNGRLIVLSVYLCKSESEDDALLCRMGVSSMDYKQLSQQIELKTGAMEAGPHLAEHHTSTGLFEQVCKLTVYLSSVSARTRHGGP